MTTKEDIDPYIELIHQVIDEAASLISKNFPIFKDITLEALETIFATKAIAKQLALAIALEGGMMTLNQVLHVVYSFLSNFSSRSRLIRHLEEQQNESQTQDEWMDLAERIDNIQGNDVWRSDPHCQLYERERISARIDEFVHLMRRRDIFELMFELRGGIGRNKFGLLHEGLFSKAMAGSKVLVETYHNVVCAALDFVSDAPVDIGQDPIPTDARLAFFNETRHSYGRTAILLSGGAALGFYHLGVVKTLMENRLMPRVVGGSSAGSIVCAIIGTRTDEECLRDLFKMEGTNGPGHSGELPVNFFRPYHFAVKNLPPAVSDVYNNNAGFFHDAKRTWQIFVPIPLRQFTSFLYDIITLKARPQELLMNDTEHFRECLRKDVGNFTFQEAFDRTGRIINITVSPTNSSDPPRLLNYLTAPHVLVWSAAVASSSLPGVFEANRLMVKDADGTVRYESAERAAFSDGSMEQDLPMQQLSEMFNVNHFIVSQANPHAVMLGSYYHVQSVWSGPIFGFVNAVLSFLKDRCRTWLSHFVELVGARRLTPQHATSRGIASQVFVQEYEGRKCDISLIPWINHRGLISAFMHCLYNPDHEEVQEWIQAAERETWKYIPAIKSHIAEEVTLDRCVQKLRKRLVVESWQKHRANSTGKKMGERVPSFFNSPSLVNLGGLGISDNTELHRYSQKENIPSYGHMATAEQPSMPLEINPGWGGMGLHGNKSSGSLPRSPSDASGLFIEEMDPTEQVAGEQTVHSSIKDHHSASSFETGGQSYVKTTNMAHFYYRNTLSQGSLKHTPGGDNIVDGRAEGRKSKSDAHLANSS